MRRKYRILTVYFMQNDIKKHGNMIYRYALKQ